MTSITINTNSNNQIVDITDLVNGHLTISNGLCFLFITHTTAGITTADLDPGTDLDMIDAFNEMIPKLSYRHPHDPSHVGDHIMSTIIGPSLTLPVRNKSLILGTWQRVVVVELDGPRERNLILSQIEQNINE